VRKKLKLTRSPAGINVRRDILEPLGIRVVSINRKPYQAPRQNNVVYGRARTISRLARRDKDGVIRALRCIQAADPSMLHSDVILAMFRYLKATRPDAPLAELLSLFKGVPLSEIRQKAVTLAKGVDGKSHAARVEGVYFFIAAYIKENTNDY
jgi:hypothetical protein